MNCAAAASDYYRWTLITTPVIDVTALALNSTHSRCVNLIHNMINLSNPSSGNILLRIREIDIMISRAPGHR